MQGCQLKGGCVYMDLWAGAWGVRGEGAPEGHHGVHGDVTARDPECHYCVHRGTDAIWGCSMCRQGSGARRGHGGCMHALGTGAVTLWAQEERHKQYRLHGTRGSSCHTERWGSGCAHRGAEEQHRAAQGPPRNQTAVGDRGLAVAWQCPGTGCSSHARPCHARLLGSAVRGVSLALGEEAWHRVAPAAWGRQQPSGSSWNPQRPAQPRAQPAGPGSP